MARIILASASPRRRELLGRLGLPYDVASADIDEMLLADEMPESAVRRVAESKARAICHKVAAGVVIGADTTVVLDGQALGKPSSAPAARAVLQALRGREHQVITGLALLDSRTGAAHVTVTTTIVGMRAYADAEIEAYVASGDPMDKAGAYAVQHEGFHPAATIVGCYANVVGLPLCTLAGGLRDLGVPLDESSRPWCRSCVAERSTASH